MKFFKRSLFMIFAITVSQTSFAISDLKNCREDAAKFCGDVKKGGGRISKCLAEHAAELTATCRKSMGLGGGAVEDSAAASEAVLPVPVKVKGQAKGEVSQKSYIDLRAVCLSELRSWCWDVKDGDTRGANDCLNKHKENLGEECTKFLAGQRP